MIFWLEWNPLSIRASPARASSAWARRASVPTVSSGPPCLPKREFSKPGVSASNCGDSKDGTPVNPDFLELLRALSAAEARFLIVGAYAVAHHGRPRATGDLD